MAWRWPSPARDGKQVTEEYKAASPEELKKENPEAYAIYQRWGGGAGPGWVIGGQGQLIVRGGGQVIVNNGNLNLNGLIQRANEDEVANLRKKLTDEMAQANLPDAKQQQVLDQLDQLDNLKRVDPDATAEEEQQRITKFMDQSDSLRKKIDELKLSDPGDALPPPAKARLGVSLVAPDDFNGDAAGLKVAKVLPDSRAAKLGLQEDDVIEKVNGQPIRSVKDLRQAAMNAKKALTLDIERAGEKIKLEEKPEK